MRLWAALIDEGEHGVAHRFGAALGLIGSEAAHSARDELYAIFPRAQ